MVIAIAGKIGSGKDTVGKIIKGLDWYNNGHKESIRQKYSEIEWVLGMLENKYMCYSNFEIKKFAGKLKQIVSILTGIPVEDLEKQEVKDRVLGEEWWYYNYGEKNVIIPYLGRKNEKDEDIKFEKYLVKPTIRQLLQEIGTEAMRDIIHPNIWINALFADYKPKDSRFNYKVVENYPSWVITDLRFPNELKAIKDKKGITIRVIRETQSDRFQKIDNDGFHKYPKQEHYSEIALDGETLDYNINNNGTIEELIEKVKEILIKENIL